MAWVFLEVALAFGIAIGIVWWTFPKKKRAVDLEAASNHAAETEAATQAGGSATDGAARTDSVADGQTAQTGSRVEHHRS